MTLTLTTDRSLIRIAHHSQRFIRAEVQAPAAAQEKPRRQVNLAFVLDRSGSMAGQKLELAKQALRQSIQRLDGNDRFCVVTFDHGVEIVVASTAATPEAKAAALESVERIGVRGNTNLSGGWLHGAEQVALNQISGGLNRCLLLTDGLANAGITGYDELVAHARELKARGISTTTFGVGRDFDEALLDGMATAGGGHFYYIENEGAIADYITSEVGEALETVVTGARLVVRAPNAAQLEAVSSFPVRGANGEWEVLLGDLISEQRLEAVLRVTFMRGQEGRLSTAMVTLKDEGNAFGDALEVLEWRYADNAENDAQPRRRPVDRAVARLYAARAQKEAVRRNRLGDFAGAYGVLMATAARTASYAGDDAELNQLVRELQELAARMQRPMDELARKTQYSSASYAMQSRQPTGYAERKSP